eukprot:SAG31_NODE_34767_length_329_cov_1.273913_1_plen_44_part_10
MWLIIQPCTPKIHNYYQIYILPVPAVPVPAALSVNRTSTVIVTS